MGVDALLKDHQRQPQALIVRLVASRLAEIT
jgi:hypothetical protein